MLVGCEKKEDSNNESSKAATASAEDFTYEKNEDGGITIKKYIAFDTNVVIPEKIDGVSVTCLGELSFSGAYNLERISMPDTVTVIETAAFRHLENLTAVDLSDSLETLGAGAFEGCSSLVEIELPESLSQLKAAAFKECTALKKINIPKSVKVLRDQTFARSGIESVTFENGVEIIEMNAFAATKLKSVVLPSSVKSIGMNSFASCANLENITFNEGLKTIADFAFTINSALTEITIPSTVTDISELAFEQCKGLKSVKFEGAAPLNYKYDGDIPVRCPEYTVYYHDGAKGFTSPEWCGYKTEKW